MKKSNYISALFVSTLLLPVIAYSAPTEAPGVIDRQIPDIKIPEGFSLDKKMAEPIKPAPEKEVADSQKVVAQFSHIDIRGAEVIPASGLQHITDAYLNRDVTADDIAALKFEIASYYYSKGFILVKVVTPPQDFKSGSLRVDVYEAKVGDVVVKNDDLIFNFVADAFASRVRTGDVFNEKDVESMISDFNSLNGIGATLNLRKGHEFNTTDLLVDLFKQDDDEQFVAVDNYGSPLTGQVVATGHLEVSNLLRTGNKIYTNVRRSDGDLWSVNVGGERPIGIKNIKVTADYLHSENEIGDRLAFQQASGETDALTFGLKSDLVYTKQQRTTVSGGLQMRYHESFSELSGVKVTTSEDDIAQLFGDIAYLERQDNAVYYADLRVIKGIDAFDADESGVGRSDPNGDPEAWRVQPTVLANVLSPISDGTLRLSASGQLSSNRLLSSDLFAIGGYGSVRGFDPAQETGESGYNFSLEYAHNMPDLGDFSLSFGPFFDGGAVYNRGVSAIDSHLYSVGLGAQMEANLVSAGTTVIRLDFAHPIGNYVSNLVDENQLFFRVTQKF